jgi:hypothetical protein
MLIAVDPGSRSVGLAVFGECNQLLRAGCVTRGKGQSLYQFAYAVAQRALDYGRIYAREGIRIVIEWPQPFAKQRPRIEDLILLGGAAGAIAAALHCTHWEAPVEHVQPSKWKGQIPKPTRTADSYLIEGRVCAILEPCEAECVELPRSVKAQWDVWDAIGLGLVSTGRAYRGVRRR